MSDSITHSPSISSTTPLSIAALTTTADSIVDAVKDRKHDTVYFLAVSLHHSLEKLEAELTTEATRDRVYLLAYDSYHFANALFLLSSEPLEWLAELRADVEHVCAIHASDYIGVSS